MVIGVGLTMVAPLQSIRFGSIDKIPILYRLWLFYKAFQIFAPSVARVPRPKIGSSVVADNRERRKSSSPGVATLVLV
jgi:hypothetical protein